MEFNNKLIIGEIKSELIEYYDSLKNEIDIKVQTLFASREKEFIISSNHRSNVNNKDSSSENFLNKIYLEFIDLCDEILNRSMNELSKYIQVNNSDSHLSKDDIKSTILTSSCMFVNNDNLDPGIL